MKPRRRAIRSTGVIVFGITSLLAGSPRAVAQGAPQRGLPNIVYILADDLGYGDVQCLNPRSKIPTPNIDRLAAEGTLFRDAHTGSAVCTPTRYGILTGRYCWRSRLKRDVLLGYSPPLIEPGRLTVPELLRRHGYATACFGKWHLGLSWPTKANAPVPSNADVPEPLVDFTKPIADGPRTRGFDYFFGISASLDMPPYVFIEDDRVVAFPSGVQEKRKEGFIRGGAKDPAFRFDQVAPTLTRRAVRYIGDRAAVARRQPFFLYLALNCPHTPVAPTAGFHGKSQAGDYGDYVAETDWAIGQVIKALDDHRLSGETLLILTSDNGPERFAYQRIQQFQHYSMGDLRGVKRDAWEGGHRVPLLARWPDKVPSGRVCDEVICHTDLMATTAAIVGADLPADAGEDSMSILPALLGQTSEKPLREATVHHTSSGKFAIRRGPWVFIDAPSGDDNREPDWLKAERGYLVHHEPGELYNLVRDLGEHRNLYAEEPEQVRQLKELLERYKREGRSVPLRR